MAIGASSATSELCWTLDPESQTVQQHHCSTSHGSLEPNMVTTFLTQMWLTVRCKNFEPIGSHFVASLGPKKAPFVAFSRHWLLCSMSVATSSSFIHFRQFFFLHTAFHLVFWIWKAAPLRAVSNFLSSLLVFLIKSKWCNDVLEKWILELPLVDMKWLACGTKAICT